LTSFDWGFLLYFFPGSGWEYHLVRYKAEGSNNLSISYRYPTPVRDWDLKAGADGSDGQLFLVAADEAGTLNLFKLFVKLNPPDGEYYFEVVHERHESDDDIRCVFWATDPSIGLVDPRIEVLADGTIRQTSTDMPYGGILADPQHNPIGGGPGIEIP
jgi:hypothetical protein